MCGKGTQSTTQQTSQTSAPSAQAGQLYSQLLNQAQGVAATPYAPYTGEQVAPVNQQQQAGISGINAYQPAFGTALDTMEQNTQPITAAQIAQYQSPYTQQVVNATQAEFNNQNQQQSQQVTGNAIAQGALGGNRTGIAQAELANQQQLAQAPVIANLQNQGYMTGLNTALTEQQAGQQGALGIANTANAGLTGANAQIGAGTLEQGTQQAQDTAAYQNYLNQLAYPFQTTQWLAGLGTGVGSQMGGTTTGTGTTTGPAPSMLSQLTGAGTTGLGVLGASGAFGSAGWMLPALAALKRGGGVNGYASGGGVADGADYPVVPETTHTLKAQQKQLINGDRHVQMFPHDTPELPLPSGMKRVKSHSGTFHYNPKHIDEGAIHHHSKAGHEHAILGLGPFSKHEILHRIAHGEHPLAIVERDEHGHEVRAALGTHNTAHVQAHHMGRGKSHGHSVHIEFPDKVLSDRMSAHRQTGGGVSAAPYAGGDPFIPSMGITMGKGAPASSGQAPQMMNTTGQTQGVNTQGMKGLTGVFQSLQNKSNQATTGGVPLAGLDPPSSDSSSDEDADPLDAPGLDYDDIGLGDDVFKRGGGVSGVSGVRGYDTGGAPEDDGMYTAPDSQLAIDPDAVTADNVPMPRSRPPEADAGVAAAPDATPSDVTAGPMPPPTTPTPDQGVATPAHFDAPNINNPSGGVAATPTPSSSSNIPDDILDKAAAATKHQESGGDYSNVTTTTNRHGQPQSALGAYGIMDFNVPQWSKEALGHSVTQDEFLNNPAIQDQIYRYKMGQYISRYGVEGAGRAWLGGEGSLNAPLAKDPFGTTVGSYGNKFASLVGEGGAAIPPSATLDRGARGSFQGIQGVASTPPGTPGGNQQSGIDWGSEGKLWPALIAAGAGMMASRSPYPGVAIGEGVGAGAQTYYGMKQNEQTQNINQQKVNLEAKKLDQNMNWHQQQYEQNQQKINVGADLKRAEIASKIQPVIGDDGQMHYVRQNQQGQLYDVNTGLPFGGNPAAAGATPAPQQQQPFQPDHSTQTNSQVADSVAKPYNYANGGNMQAVTKGAPIPEPMPISGHSPESLKADAEYYFQTGKLPAGVITARGSGPAAQLQNQYSTAVRNYATALASQRGLSSEQWVDAQRSAPGMLKFLSGADGRATVSLGTAMRHLDTLNQYAQAWEKGDTGIQALNSIRARLSNEFGSDAATNVQTVSSIVGPEILKAIGIAGAGGQEDRDRILGLFSTAKTANQMQNAIVAAEKLMGGQLEGKERQAAAEGVNHDKFVGLIGDKPYSLLKQIDSGGGLNSSGNTPAAQPTFNRGAAEQWLQSNPNDPRAAAVRQKLQQMP